MFVLAELLHVPVYELKQRMPASEYMGWQEYLTEKNKAIEESQRQAAKGKSQGRNLLDGSTEDLIAGLTGGR